MGKSLGCGRIGPPPPKPYLSCCPERKPLTVAEIKARIEELIDELKEDYTIVIVTHNMQQAARVSDFTAFMYLGELIEFDNTSKLFTNPSQKATEDYITGRYG